MKRSLFVFILLPLLCSALLLAGCGSSGSGSDSNNNGTETTSISGSVFAAVVNGATVTVETSDGTVVAGPVSTAADGSYTLDVPTARLGEDLQFIANGGTFTDEATGTAGVPGGPMAAFIPAETLTAGGEVHLDPGTTIVHGMVTADNAITMEQANTYFYNAFGFTPDPSVAPRIEAPTDDNLPNRLAALHAGAFSYLAQNCGLTPDQQFAMLGALSTDLADGTMDGKDVSLNAITIDGTTPLPADAQYRFAGAMCNCGNAVTDLGLSATRVQTPSYIIDFIPPAMTRQGKSTFTIKVTDAATTAAVSGKTLTLAPIMHMANKIHASPVDPLIVDNGDGTYTCTVYYLMMSGPTMGFWELQVTIDDETAIFYPEVGMPMGTPLVKLYGVADKVAATGGAAPAPRTYLIFKDGFNAAANTFNLFIAARDDAAMMSFPAVSGDSTLHDPSGTEWTVDPATTSVSVSADNVTYVAATDNGNGHWSASDPALVLVSGGKVYVKLTVNGEAKTDITGALNPASFTLPTFP